MTNYKARPTVYKGVKMRSRLEAGYAAWLDGCGFAWEYEPCAFATEDGQYLPDFMVVGLNVSWKPEPVVAYIEAKPGSFDDYELVVEQMSVIRSCEPEAVCVVQVGPSAEQRTSSVSTLWLPGDEPDDGPPIAAFRRCVWVMGVKGKPMLALRWFPDLQGPWAHGYWKVGR